MTSKTITVLTPHNHARPSLTRALLAWIHQGRERARQRYALARLNDTQLQDIGLTRRDVAGETAKPFWRV